MAPNTSTTLRRDTDDREKTTLSEEDLQELTPSAKLVLKVIDYEGPMTQQALAVETRLPQRTVRDATGLLLDAGLVERQVYIPDARQSNYALLAELP